MSDSRPYGSGAYGTGAYGQGKPSWPAVKHEINTTRLPNDPNGTDTWVDVTDRVVSFTTRRGRSDELTAVQAGTLEMTLRNGDSRFDPANAASDLYPNLRPNRQARTTVVWKDVVYPIAYGYEESGWPQSYDMGGRYSWCKPVFQDALAVLAQVPLGDAVDAEVLVDAPTVYFRLAEAGGTVGYGAQGTRQPMLNLAPGPGQTATFGGPAVVPTSTATSLKTSYFASGTGGGVDPATVVLFGPMTGSTATLECWYQMPAGFPGDTADKLIARLFVPFVGTVDLRRDTTANGNRAVLNVRAGATQVFSTVNLADGAPHHLLATVAGTAAVFYVDGVLVGTATMGSAFTVAGTNYAYVGTAGGLFSRLAVYNTALAPARVTAHYVAGTTGFAGDTGSQRVRRLLSYAAWLFARQTSGFNGVDAGDADTPLLAVANSGSIAAALQQVADSTLADVDVDGAGRVRYRSRDYRLLQRTPAVTFGEMAGNGEVPYVDGLTFDTAPDYIYSQVQVTQQNGIVVNRSDASAVLEVFQRTLTRTVQLRDPGQVVDLADYLLALYKGPRPRVKKIRVQPSSQPGIWAQVLGLDFGSRVRVIRRLPGVGTVGVSTVKTVDCYVESIAHTVTEDSWEIEFGLSPASPFTPWVLGDATASVLGSTTIPTF